MEKNKKILIVIVSTIFLLLAAIFSTVAFLLRETTISNVQTKSELTAEIVKDSLTSHMENGFIDKRKDL